MLQAMNTGHDGSLSTLHANRPADALLRLENMLSMGASSMSTSLVRRQLASALGPAGRWVERSHDGARHVTRHHREVVRMGDDDVGCATCTSTTGAPTVYRRTDHRPDFEQCSPPPACSAQPGRCSVRSLIEWGLPWACCCWCLARRWRERRAPRPAARPRRGRWPRASSQPRQRRPGCATLAATRARHGGRASAPAAAGLAATFGARPRGWRCLAGAATGLLGFELLRRCQRQPARGALAQNFPEAVDGLDARGAGRRADSRRRCGRHRRDVRRRGRARAFRKLSSQLEIGIPFREALGELASGLGPAATSISSARCWRSIATAAASFSHMLATLSRALRSARAARRGGYAR